jgi:hypothetical protein
LPDFTEKDGLKLKNLLVERILKAASAVRKEFLKAASSNNINEFSKAA